MKNGDIIKFAALILIALVLLYRKYGKKYNKKMNDGERAKSDKEFPGNDNYEPYSGGKA